MRMGKRTDFWSQGGQVACGLAKSRHWQVRSSLGSPFLSEGRLLAVACPGSWLAGLRAQPWVVRRPCGQAMAP